MIKFTYKAFILDLSISNGNSTANLSSANFVNVASTRGRVFGAFCVDVVTRQTCRHLPSRVTRTRQTRERRVWRVLCEFSESGEFGECRLDHFMHIKYVICA